MQVQQCLFWRQSLLSGCGSMNVREPQRPLQQTDLTGGLLAHASKPDVHDTMYR